MSEEKKTNDPNEPNDLRVTIFHKETGEPFEVYTVDAKEILRNPNSEYQRRKPGSVAAETAVMEEPEYPEDMPTDDEFDDMGIKDLKEFAKVRFNAEISHRKKSDAVAAIKKMFAAEMLNE